jgi:hypothetical protein
MATAEKFSAKEAAIQVGTDARTLRKFLRASDDFDAVGQGNRYEFTSKEIKALKKKFDAWASKKPTTAKVKDEAPIEDLEVDDEGEHVGPGEDAGEVGEGDPDEDEPALEDLEPSDDDLEEIDLTDEDL